MSAPPDISSVAAAAPAAVTPKVTPVKPPGLMSKLLPPVIVFILGIAAWVGLHYLLNEDKAITVPLPWDVLKVGVFDWTNFQMVLTSLWLSAKSALVGLVVTIVVGLGFAIAMSQAKWVENALLPYAIAMQTTPILALVPVIGVVLGYNFPSRVLVVVLISSSRSSTTRCSASSRPTRASTISSRCTTSAAGRA